jgi:RNA polymerase sigma factor (sigma-70 family)
MTEGSDLRTSASLLGRLGADPQNAAAWEEFVRRYGGEIFRWCRNWKLQDADAQDVTQNVLLRVARQMQRFRYDPSQSFRGWLKTVTHAAWCDWLEAQKRQNQGSGDSHVLQVLATVEARDDLLRKLEQEYDLELFEAASARVRLRVEPQTWEAFRLQALEGLSGAEAAKRLGMKVGLAFVAKSRVQKMLQDVIKELDVATVEPAG